MTNIKFMIFTNLSHWKIIGNYHLFNLIFDWVFWYCKSWAFIDAKTDFFNPEYRIYLSERPGCSFNFEFSKGGAYSREALFQRGRSFNISKRHQNSLNLSLKSNNNNSNNNRIIECLMFKIVCKTPLFTKEK